MVEATFAAGIKKFFEPFKDYYHREEPEFMTVSGGIFESESLIETIYGVYLSLLAEGWRSNGQSVGRVDDIGSMYLNGFFSRAPLASCWRVK